MAKNQAAVDLGKLAAGKPKKYSAEELAKRTARLPKRLFGARKKPTK